MARTAKAAKEKAAVKPKPKPKAPKANSRKRKVDESANPFECPPDPGQSSILRFAGSGASMAVQPAEGQQEVSETVPASLTEAPSEAPSTEVPVAPTLIDTASISGPSPMLEEMPSAEEMPLADVSSALKSPELEMRPVEVQPSLCDISPAVKSDTQVEALQEEMHILPHVPSTKSEITDIIQEDNDVPTHGEVSEHGIEPDVHPGQDDIIIAGSSAPSTHDDAFHAFASGSSINLGAVVDAARICVSNYTGQEWKHAVHSFIEKQDENIFWALIQECQTHPLFNEHCEEVFSSAGVDGSEWVFGSADGDPLEDLSEMVCWLVGKDSGTLSLAPTVTTVCYA